jgi:hypothetical protein
MNKTNNKKETKSKKPLLQVKVLPKNFNKERTVLRQSCVT